MTLQEIIDLAKKHARVTYPSVLIAQALHESGLLTSKGASGLATIYKNWFGIKGSYKGKTTPKLDTAEFIDGQWIEIKDGFRWYETDDQSFEDREDLLDSDWGRSVYSRFHQAETVEGQTLGLQGVYATDPTYSDKLLAYIKQYNLKQYDVGFVIGKGIEKGSEEMAVTTAQLVAEIKKHVGVTKYSTAHKALVDYYNTQKSLPRGTRMTYDWDWCALFVSVVLMRLGVASKYGTEISVGFFKQKFIEAKIWKGKTRPQVGDIIIWNWDEATSPGGWPDHIGFVTAVNGNYITTSEGNTFKNGVSLVGSNTYLWNASSIQGYARPKYGSATVTEEAKEASKVNQHFVVTIDNLRAFNQPSSSATIVENIKKDYVKNIDMTIEAEGYIWGGWISSADGKRRYTTLQTSDGKRKFADIKDGTIGHGGKTYTEWLKLQEKDEQPIGGDEPRLAENEVLLDGKVYVIKEK
ncbi:glucosaminidase domain-containing protein [Jeotgalibaca porci]|uniref:glucosaminidase domain-containing protein n=1 Tax=Jeotgalibaca porci TaxID=1868793 RepID=UPI00359F7687